jgi:formylglycine-generating enzyme required for sulfatase activity
MEYLDFELEIGQGAGRDYPVAVLRSPAGEARGTMRFPFDQLALESRLKDLQIALLRSGGTRRKIPTSEEQAVQGFGQALFEALFGGDIRSCYDRSVEHADRQDRGLRLKLRIQSPQLAALPWEFLYDARCAEYVCLSTHTPVVRYMELPQPPQVLQVTPPLRILGMIAAPTNLPELDVAREKERVGRALSGLISQGTVQLTWLEGQTSRDLQKAMRRGGLWHIFYFVGHGGFDPLTDEGLVALVNEEGAAQYLPATQLARLLADHRTLRLAVLNACEGARGSERDIFSSAAAILVRRGIPAVLAMQYEITDAAAVEFARSFYEALADGLPVDAAVSEARKGVSLSVSNSVEWGTPVLYMRAPSGLLFDLAAAVPPAQPPPPVKAEPPAPAAREPAPAEPPVTRTPAPSILSPRAALRQAMNDKLDVDEVRTACFDLGIDSADLGGDTKGALIIGLIGRVERTERGPELMGWLRANRRDCDWPDPFGAATRGVAAKAKAVEDSLVIDSPFHLELVRVPAGEFLMGSDNNDPGAFADEKPRHTLRLAEFLIGKYPATVCQFAAFVKATGHKTTAEQQGSGWVWQDSKWQAVNGANWQHPSGPKTDVGKKGDHPVTQVSWHDALAFCHWLSEATGRPFRLPTEAEWEKAARGTDGRLYPWGDGAPNERLCNFDNKVGDTTPVGKCPAGASPYGALDMAGNVWEWTGSLWGESADKPDFAYPYDAGDGREKLDAPDAVRRVLRGGAYYSDAGHVRCASRSWYNPDARNWFVGFRVVGSPFHS